MKRLTAALTTMGLMLTTVLSFAEPGIQTGWFFQQLGLAILIISGGLVVMYFIQKQTSKAVITLIVGSLLYIIVGNPQSTFTAIGNFLKGLFGIG